jgi:hypothetical protein
MSNIFLIGALWAATVIFGNLVYLYISVAFCQMLKSGTPFFNILFAYMLGVGVPPFRKLLSVAVIIFGCVISSAGEITFSWTGLFIQLMAEASEALRLTLTQKVLQRENFSPFENLYFICPVACFCQVGVAMWYEWAAFSNVKPEHWKFFLISAALGLGLNFITGVVVKQTSGLTLKILALTRNSMLVMAMSVLGWETVTATASLGYMISLLGFAYYSLGDEITKYLAMERQQKYVLAMSPQTRDEGTHLAKANGNSAPEVLRQVALKELMGAAQQDSEESGP